MINDEGNSQISTYEMNHCRIKTLSMKNRNEKSLVFQNIEGGAI